MEAAARPPGGAWSAPDTLSAAGQDATAPQVALDASGDGVAVWDRLEAGSLRSVEAAGYDGAGPMLTATVPASALVGQAVEVSVASVDVWSALAGEPTWDFGDGAGATGSSASHVYAAPGAYTVRVAHADALGNSSTASARIEIRAPGPRVGSAACRSLAPPPPPRAGTSAVALTVGQLRTNQRIGQAAIRRLNAVSAWLDAGIEGRDICGGAIGAAKLAPGIATALAPRPLAPARRPSPRPVRVAAARRSAAQLSLTAAQLRINQRISQAAVRRANALGVRLSGQLTGGDLLAGTLGQEVLADRLQVIGAVPGPEPAPSRTIVAPRRPGPRGTVRLTASQLRIDQRIARAAVRRANLLIARLEAGLTGEEFAEASIDARRLAPGVVRAP